jgi:DtxR family Mn-dependent transcriptional regulator
MEQTKLSQTIEDYLSLIYVLERDEEPVIGAYLAELLGVTPPTVTNTLKRMSRDGLVFLESDGPHLTNSGWEAARTVVRRHMLMEWMMQRMLPWSRLHTEAHNLEHAISTEVENAVFDEVGKPQTCPHGNPLPGYEHTVADWVPLSNIQSGQQVTIRRIHELAEENTELLEFLEKKGVMPGESCIVTEVLPFNQTLTISIQDHEVTLGVTVAKYVLVET